MSFAQFHLLRTLAEVDECPASKLAAEADLTPASVTQALDHLAEVGYVERVRSDADRRVVLNRLTPTGREVFEAKRAAFEQRWKEALADLSASSSARPRRCCGAWPRCWTRSESSALACGTAPRSQASPRGGSPRGS